MNIIKSPQDNIEAYLYDDINIIMYDGLIDIYKYNEITTLEFFNELFREFNFFIENKENYRTIKTHFEEYRINYNLIPDDDLELDEYYRKIRFLQQLGHLIEWHFSENDDEITLKSCEFIQGLTHKKFEAETIEKKFDFNLIVQFINTLPTTRAKILYLTYIKTDYLQDIKTGYLQDPLSEILAENFKNKCELEIQKFKEILELETESLSIPPPTITQEQTKETINETEQKLPYKIALLHELGFFKLDAIKKLTKEKQYKVIGALTGGTHRTIKGNVLVLDPDSNENRMKYTSNNYTDEVKNYLDKLK